MILRDEKPDARDEFAGRVLRSNLYTAEPVRMQHLAPALAGFLSTVLQPGQRGIGLLISEDKTAGGFILPNDRVDVLHTVVRDFQWRRTADRFHPHDSDEREGPCDWSDDV
jgi:pilus assembly protein CpaB